MARLETERLLLREFVPEDYDALRELDSDPEVLRYRSRDHISPEMTREFLTQAQTAAGQDPRQQYAFAVVERKTGDFVGQCGLTVTNLAYTDAFMWYSVLRRYWNQGYMTEAARALLDFGLGPAGLRRITAECLPANLASARVMEKIGMRKLEATGERLRYAAGDDKP